MVSTSQKIIPFPKGGRLRSVVHALSIASTACVMVAIVIQDHTSFVPLGVFNTGAVALSRLADALLVLASAALALQLAEAFTGRFRRVCGIIRGVFAFVIILNVLLIFGDRLFVTGDPAGLLGQYYEVPSAGRRPVILKKNVSGAATDPCLLAPEANGGPRVLFLGDSFTEGSGRARECNYPNVVESMLREQWNPNARVVNAGVSGYGPAEALNLLRWHRARGCRIDAVVYNLVLENDCTDNPPRTERRVVAGIISRFPSSWFLRTFHPLNMRTFRWAMILTFFARASTKDMLNAVAVDKGPCDLSTTPLTEASPFVRATVLRNLEGTRRVASIPDGRRGAFGAVGEMRDIATELGVPFVVVVFPDRILVDVELQQAMSITNDALAPAAANRAAVKAEDWANATIDVGPQLTGHSGMYRDADTHLSDLGNVVAGRYVGESLASRLPR